MPRKKKDSETPAAPVAEPQAVAPASDDAPEDVTAPVEVTDEVGVRPGAGDVPRALTFRLGEQLYGLPIESVQEIQQIVELMPMPDASPALVGLLDVRGLVVPAVDLRVLVGMERREYTLETPMVFCLVHGQVVCLIVDSVEDVVEVPEGCMQPPTSLYALADRMLGVCRLAQGLVMMFDLERLVPDEALSVAVAAGGEGL